MKITKAQFQQMTAAEVAIQEEIKSFLTADAINVTGFDLEEGKVFANVVCKEASEAQVDAFKHKSRLGVQKQGGFGSFYTFEVFMYM